MPLTRKILTLSTLLGLTLVTACGTTRAFPPPPIQIPVRADLRQACEQLATPAEGQLPTLAPEGSDARRAQLVERAFWMQLDLMHNGIEATQCARYLELLRLIDGYNSAATEAARTWPR